MEQDPTPSQSQKAQQQHSSYSMGMEPPPERSQLLLMNEITNLSSASSDQAIRAKNTKIMQAHGFDAIMSRITTYQFATPQHHHNIFMCCADKYTGHL